MNNNNNKNSSSSSSNLPTNLTASDLIDAKLEKHQVCGSKHCPECGHKLEGKPDWLGLPAGVKFDPTDQELIEHLEAKVESKDMMKPHPLIDEFIPTIEGEDGICYTHPEKLPGVTRDGQNRHFFHRPSKAYTTGTRKRRKIQTETDLQGGETRWHKTGKTRPVMANGTQKGCKKILVLYTNFGKNRKPEKTNWVMHQYHLGQHEEEKEGELVVSKIFYQTQPRQCNWSDRSLGTTSAVGEGSAGPTDPNLARRSNMNFSQGNEINISSYNPSIVVDIQQLNKSEQFGFAPYRKNFDEVDSIISFSQATSSKVAIGGETSTVREAPATTCETDPYQRLSVAAHHHLPPHSQMVAAATAAFHISRPSSSISSIIAPTPLHHASIINLEDHDSFHQVSRLMLQNEFQQQQQQQHQIQQQQQHHKLGGRVASGLEEIIMSCTSSETNKAETSMQPIQNPQNQEPEWLKYSSYWPDPDNPDHHG